MAAQPDVYDLPAWSVIRDLWTVRLLFTTKCQPEPLPGPYRGSANLHAPEISVQSYAKAIIVSLREELEQERSAHAHTRAQAEADILALSARLARREAQLEALNLRVVESQDTPERSRAAAEQKDSAQRWPEERPSTRPAFSREEAIQILELTAARNRELEVEVRHLRQSVSLGHPSVTSTLITYDPYYCSP